MSRVGRAAFGRALLLMCVVGAAACVGGSGRGSAASLPAGDCCNEAGKRIAERFRVSAITTRRFTHTELWTALDPVMRGAPMRVTTFGGASTIRLVASNCRTARVISRKIS